MSDDTGHGERIARPRRQEHEMKDPVVGELCIHVVKLLDDLTEKLKAEVAIRGITDEQVVAARDLVESKSPHPDSDAHAALLDRVVWGVGDDVPAEPVGAGWSGGQDSAGDSGGWT